MSNLTTEYYNENAESYDLLHGGEKNPEHIWALERSWPLIENLVGSVLDVGCGTGRSLKWYAKRKPSLELMGLDPSEGLLKAARADLPQARLETGYGESLPFADNSVDIAIATGIMHHVDHPDRVIKEMLRVATRAVLISDHNNFAFQSIRVRRVRLWLYATGLLNLATYVSHGFRKQGYSEGDGWWYPYSLFDNYAELASGGATVYIIPTAPPNLSKGNLLLTQSHAAILVLKPSKNDDSIRKQR